MRAFLGWLRGEKRHCSMAAIPTLEEEGARPNRERQTLVGEQTRLRQRQSCSRALLIAAPHPGAFHVLSRQGIDGSTVNPKRIYRLYKEMGLQLRNKTPKRRGKAKLREDRVDATPGLGDGLRARPTAAGRKIRMLAVVDTFSRFRASRQKGVGLDFSGQASRRTMRSSSLSTGSSGRGS